MIKMTLCVVFLTFAGYVMGSPLPVGSSSGEKLTSNIQQRNLKTLTLSQKKRFKAAFLEARSLLHLSDSATGLTRKIPIGR